jgi:plasmid stabilization system protein ParE
MSGRSLEVLPGAIADTKETRLWYAARSPQAAFRFMSEVDRASEIILESPDRWPKHQYGTRRYRLDKFPYFVVYRVFTDRVQIVAYQHVRRRSNFWRGRGR